MSQQMAKPPAEECPYCEVGLVETLDRHGYALLVCPECDRWKRPGWDELNPPR